MRGTSERTTVVLGVDGSEHAERAVEWCANYAAERGAGVVVVHAVELPVHAVAARHGLPSLMTEAERDALCDVVGRDWCKPLAGAGVAFTVELFDDGAAGALMDASRAHVAELVVVGRRGRGGFAELVLGSTSHHLAQHLDRPLVIVP